MPFQWRRALQLQEVPVRQAQQRISQTQPGKEEKRSGGSGADEEEDWVVVGKVESKLEEDWGVVGGESDAENTAEGD